MITRNNLLSLFLFLGLTTFAYATNIKILTENYPPYNMQTNNKLSGISVDILKEILKELKSKQTIDDVKMTTWSRAYSYVQKKQNHMLFSTTRTKQREDLFKWVGPIATTTIALIAKKDRNIKINSTDELNNYKIGTILKDIGEQLLQKNGVKAENIYSVSSKDAIKISFKKLEKNRIDLFSYDFNVAKYSAKLEGFDTSKYEIVYILQKGELYYAFNKNTSDDIILKWQKALDKIKKDSRYKHIVTKYLENNKEIKIKLLTEEMSPWQMKIGNKLVGSSVEIIQEIQKRLGNKEKIIMLPWNRGYNMTLKKKGYALFSTTRTQQREKLFKWVGPLFAIENSMFKHIDDKTIYKTLEDAKKAKSIIVVNNDVQEQYLTKMGFKNLKIRFNKSAPSNIQYLLKKKAQLIPLTSSTGNYLMNQEGLKDKIILTQIPPFNKNDLYIAFHIDTPDFIIDKWQKALDGIKRDGTYQKIIDAYK